MIKNQDLAPNAYYIVESAMLDSVSPDVSRLARRSPVLRMELMFLGAVMQRLGASARITTAELRRLKGMADSLEDALVAASKPNVFSSKVFDDIVVHALDKPHSTVEEIVRCGEDLTAYIGTSTRKPRVLRRQARIHYGAAGSSKRVVHVKRG